MQWLGMVAVATALVWLFAGYTALAATSRMARHGESAARRMQAAWRARLANSVMLLCKATLLLIGVLVFARGGPLNARVSDTGQILIAAAVVAYMLLIVVTLWLPELPGRVHLRQAENVCAVMFSLALGLLSVMGIRFGLDSGLPFGSAGALSLMFGFFVLARPYLRGGCVVLLRIGEQGTPGREATLKRLLRRYRPFVIANGVALLVGALLL